MKKLRGKIGVIFLLGGIFISGNGLLGELQASDRDVDPYLIYIDPVTGKYTTQKPGHDTTTPVTQSDSSVNKSVKSTPLAKTALTPLFVISGGMLLFSYLLALCLVKLRAKQDYP